MLDDAFCMIFPGTAPMSRLADLVERAKGRYQFVEKTYEGVETLQKDGVAVVYARGTLNGAWLDGSPFNGIRFIDRFEVKNGKARMR